MAFPTLKLAGFTFTGASVAGTFTAISCKELGVAFDVGNGPSFLIGRRHFLLTHGHADHAAGLPYLLSMKALARHPKAQVHVPAPLAEPLKSIIQTWEQIEGHSYNYEIHANDDGKIALKGSYFARTFPTFHRVASNGYTVFERKKKLKAEFSQRHRDDIVQAKKQGIDIHHHVETPIISFTGDTKIEFFDACPWIKKSKILFVEVSFIDDKRSIDETREWGHIHLDELLPRISEFEGEQLVLIHLSARYSTEELERRLDEKLDATTRSKVLVFPRS